MDSTPHPIERHPVQRKKGRGGSGPVTIFNPGGVDTAGTSAIARLSGNNTYSGGTTIGDEPSSTGTEVITLNVSAGTKVPFTSGSGRPS